MGSIKSAVVNYSQNGVSMGTATVTFRRSADADRAVREYDKAEVDGKPMSIKLIGQLSTVPVVVKKRKPQPPQLPVAVQQQPQFGLGVGAGFGLPAAVAPQGGAAAFNPFAAGLAFPAALGGFPQQQFAGGFSSSFPQQQKSAAQPRNAAAPLHASFHPHRRSRRMRDFMRVLDAQTRCRCSLLWMTHALSAVSDCVQSSHCCCACTGQREGEQRSECAGRSGGSERSAECSARRARGGTRRQRRRRSRSSEGANTERARCRARRVPGQQGRRREQDGLREQRAERRRERGGVRLFMRRPSGCCCVSCRRVGVSAFALRWSAVVTGHQAPLQPSASPHRRSLLSDRFAARCGNTTNEEKCSQSTQSHPL